MERLTKRDEKGKVTINFEAIGKPFGNDTVYDVFDLYYIACDRLAAYEDTGLTPAQVEAMKMDMEQLRADNINAEMNLAHMTADKDEQAGRIMQMEEALRQTKTAINDLMACNEISKIADVRGEEAIKAIEALLGGKEDA